MHLKFLTFFPRTIGRILPLTAPFHMKEVQSGMDSLRHRLRNHFNLKRLQNLTARRPGHIKHSNTTVPTRLPLPLRLGNA